jgi:hypothetical protein
MRFHSVIKLLPEKGMMHGQRIGTEMRYEHHSIRGLHLYIDHGAKTIRATAYGVSALSQVVDDFNLPLYRRDGGGA